MNKFLNPSSRKRLKQYELFTSRQYPNDMPHPVFAENRKAAMKLVMARKEKGEKILSLKRSW